MNLFVCNLVIHLHVSIDDLFTVIAPLFNCISLFVMNVVNKNLNFKMLFGWFMHLFMVYLANISKRLE